MRFQWNVYVSLKGDELFYRMWKFRRRVKIRRLLSDFIFASHYAVLKVADVVTLRLQEQSTFLITDWLTLVCVCAYTHTCMHVLYVCLCLSGANTFRTLCADSGSDMGIFFHQWVHIFLHASKTCVCVQAQTSLNIHQICLHDGISKVVQPKWTKSRHYPDD